MKSQPITFKTGLHLTFLLACTSFSGILTSELKNEPSFINTTIPSTNPSGSCVYAPSRDKRLGDLPEKYHHIMMGYDLMQNLVNSSSVSKNYSNNKVAIVDSGFRVDPENSKVGKQLTLDLTKIPKEVESGNYEHGTAVAGLVSSKAFGVNSKINTLLFPISSIETSAFGPDSKINTKLYDEAFEKISGSNDIKVVNLSMSLGEDSESNLEQYLTLLDKGIWIVTGSGNESSKLSRNSAIIEKLIEHKNFFIASSISPYSSPSAFTDYGKNEYFLPGSSVQTLNTGNSKLAKKSFETALSGTSFSSPQLSGVLATMRSLSKNLTGEYAHFILQSTSINFSGYIGGSFIKLNRLNPLLAVKTLIDGQQCLSQPTKKRQCLKETVNTIINESLTLGINASRKNHTNCSDRIQQIDEIRKYFFLSKGNTDVLLPELLTFPELLNARNLFRFEEKIDRYSYPGEEADNDVANLFKNGSKFMLFNTDVNRQCDKEVIKSLNPLEPNENFVNQFANICFAEALSDPDTYTTTPYSSINESLRCSIGNYECIGYAYSYPQESRDILIQKFLEQLKNKISLNETNGINPRLVSSWLYKLEESNQFDNFLLAKEVITDIGLYWDSKKSYDEFQLITSFREYLGPEIEIDSFYINAFTSYISGDLVDFDKEFDEGNFLRALTFGPKELVDTNRETISKGFQNENRDPSIANIPIAAHQAMVREISVNEFIDIIDRHFMNIKKSFDPNNRSTYEPFAEWTNYSYISHYISKYLNSDRVSIEDKRKLASSIAMMFSGEKKYNQIFIKLSARSSVQFYHSVLNYIDPKNKTATLGLISEIGKTYLSKSNNVEDFNGGNLHKLLTRANKENLAIQELLLEVSNNNQLSSPWKKELRKEILIHNTLWMSHLGNGDRKENLEILMAEYSNLFPDLFFKLHFSTMILSEEAIDKFIEYIDQIEKDEGIQKSLFRIISMITRENNVFDQYPQNMESKIIKRFHKLIFSKLKEAVNRSAPLNKYDFDYRLEDLLDILIKHWGDNPDVFKPVFASYLALIEKLETLGGTQIKSKNYGNIAFTYTRSLMKSRVGSEWLLGDKSLNALERYLKVAIEKDTWFLDHLDDNPEQLMIRYKMALKKYSR